MKELKIRLPKSLYEDFYRLFPGHGERQIILRWLISSVAAKYKNNEAFREKLLDYFLEE